MEAQKVPAGFMALSGKRRKARGRRMAQARGQGQLVPELDGGGGDAARGRVLAHAAFADPSPQSRLGRDRQTGQARD